MVAETYVPTVKFLSEMRTERLRPKRQCDQHKPPTDARLSYIHSTMGGPQRFSAAPVGRWSLPAFPCGSRRLQAARGASGRLRSAPVGSRWRSNAPLNAIRLVSVTDFPPPCLLVLLGFISTNRTTFSSHWQLYLLTCCNPRCIAWRYVSAGCSG